MDASFDWDEMARQTAVTPRLWRDFSDMIYKRLLSRWLKLGSYQRVLKTDLFDEVHGCGLVSFLRDSVTEVHAIDISEQTVNLAQALNPELNAKPDDVRQLTYDNDTFDLVISNSTLDHFEREQDLYDSLAELYRVLRPGGTCLVSLDNLSNPVIRVRNLLPFGPLHRIGLLPYYVGHTLTPESLKGSLQKAGFEVTKQSAIMHVPRLLAIWLCKLTENFDSRWLESRLLAFLSVFEVMEHWPLRDMSGYFTICLAMKPKGAPSPRTP